MKIKKVMWNGRIAAVVNSGEVLVRDGMSALELLLNVREETGCDAVAVNQEAVCEEFFRLSSGLAGEILQKFINYQMKFALYGDFSRYTSQPLRDFIYESNQGGDIFFVPTEEEAVRKLAEAQ